MSTAAISIHSLATALGLAVRGNVVAFVGGGGKTTALFALGRQLPGSVVLSTTTKMGSDRTGGHRPLLDPTPADLTATIGAERVALVWKGIDDHRALGYTDTELAALVDGVDHVVIEADGSRRRPFKAPAAHEPVVPRSTTTLVACVGAAAFDASIEQVCHRPAVVADIAGCAPADLLTPARLAAVLTSARGSRKDCPPSARFVVLLNQVTKEHEAYVAALEEVLADAAPVVAVAPFDPDDSPEIRPAGR